MAASDTDKSDRNAEHEMRRRAVRKRRNAILPMLLDLCEILEEAAGNTPSYVQVGAHDGVLGDPMHKRACSGRWRGLLLEPSKTYFDRLQALHGDRETMTLENLGISNLPGSLTLYRLSEAAADLYPPHLTGCASLKKERLWKHMAPHHPPEDNHIETETVQVERLETVLDRHNIATATGLIVDVEGHERPVFASFDFARFSPRFIQFEHKHLTRKSRQRIAEKCRDAGYTVLLMRNEVLCLEPNLAREGLLTALKRLGAEPFFAA